MNRRLELWLDRMLVRSPAQWLFESRAQRQLAVLAYHGVEDAERFALQLDWLCQNTCPLSLADTLDVLAGSRSLPPRAVLITFDDGDRSVLEVGMPLLRERDLPAVVFVVAGLIDSDRPRWWIEVEELVARGARLTEFSGASAKQLVRALKQVKDARRLAALEELRSSAGPQLPIHQKQLTSNDLVLLESAGMAIGNHTMTHPCLHQCSEQKISEEIIEADRRLQSILGHQPRAFAYPNGDFTPVAATVLAGLGYEAGFLFDHRLMALPPGNPLAISRLRVNSNTRLDRYRAILSGLHPAIHRARGGT